MAKHKMNYSHESFLGKTPGGGTFNETSGTAGGTAKSAETMARIPAGRGMSKKHDSGTDLGDFLRKRQRANSVRQDEGM